MLRAHRAELQACRALARIGRTLVFKGAGYQKWLDLNEQNVEFELACNSEQHAHKRNRMLPQKGSLTPQ